MWSFLGREGVRERAKGWYFWPYGVGMSSSDDFVLSSSLINSLVSIYLPFAFSSLLFSLVDD